MKIALVDDDQNCLNEMAMFCHDFSIQNCCQIETVLFSGGKAFLEALDSTSFSVVFMDVYMNEIDGILTALKMREKDQNCILIFLTSSMEFMPDAFSCHAFEYIVKPFSRQRITAVLLDVLKVLPLSSKYMEISSNRKTIPVFFHHIISVITDAHYLNIQLADNTILRSRMTISEFMEKARGDSRFILINKGIILNADYILDFEDHCCILENGERFPIRVRSRQKTEQAVRNYHFEKIRNRQRHDG